MNLRRKDTYLYTGLGQFTDVFFEVEFLAAVKPSEPSVMSWMSMADGAEPKERHAGKLQLLLHS